MSTTINASSTTAGAAPSPSGAEAAVAVAVAAPASCFSVKCQQFFHAFYLVLVSMVLLKPLKKLFQNTTDQLVLDYFRRKGLSRAMELELTNRLNTDEEEENTITDTAASGASTSVVDTDEPITPVTIGGLPAEVWTDVIFCFLGNVTDLLNLERTCVDLYQVMQNKENAEFWKVCPGGTADYHCEDMSNRERACVHYVSTILIPKEQRKTDNIIESELGISLWVNLCASAIRRAVANPAFGPVLFVSPDRNEQHEFGLRGDASFDLMEMGNQALITQFGRANLIMVGVLKPGVHFRYPSLNKNDLHLQGQLQLPANEFQDVKSCWWLHAAVAKSLVRYTDPQTMTALITNLLAEFASQGFTMDRIDKMILRMSRRAGVVKIETEVYMVGLEMLLYTILGIVLPACHKSVNDYKNDLVYILGTTGRVVLHSHQSIRDVAPIPYLRTPGSSNNNNNNNNIVNPIRHFVIVPKNLEVTARSFACVSPIIYGDGWHVMNPTLTRAQEQEQARAMYEFLLPDAAGAAEPWELSDIDGNAAALLDVVSSDDEDDTVARVASGVTTENGEGNDDDDDNEEEEEEEEEEEN